MTLRNAVLVQTRDTWMEATSASSISAFRRRETMLALGAYSDASTIGFIMDRVLDIYATPREQITVGVDSHTDITKAYPFYRAGDLVQTLDSTESTVTEDVQSVTITVSNESGISTETVVVKDQLQELDEEYMVAIQKMARGVIVGSAYVGAQPAVSERLIPPRPRLATPEPIPVEPTPSFDSFDGSDDDRPGSHTGSLPDPSDLEWSKWGHISGDTVGSCWGNYGGHQASGFLSVAVPGGDPVCTGVDADYSLAESWFRSNQDLGADDMHIEANIDTYSGSPIFILGRVEADDADQNWETDGTGSAFGVQIQRTTLSTYLVRFQWINSHPAWTVGSHGLQRDAGSWIFIRTVSGLSIFSAGDQLALEISGTGVNTAFDFLVNGSVVASCSGAQTAARMATLGATDSDMPQGQRGGLGFYSTGILPFPNDSNQWDSYGLVPL